jgi:hypothetical protein
LYRSEYPGEFVVVETKWSGGKKTQTREWIANPIENQHISGRAACIASNVDTHRFDHVRLERHRGGLLGSKKLQTYGTGTIAQSMRLDFACESNIDQLTLLLDSGYTKDNITYTTIRNCLQEPGEYYIVPHRPRFCDQALLLYLAAFDGHKEIFLLGYNKETVCDYTQWQQHVTEIIKGYSGIQFYLVGEKSNFFPEWVNCANVSTMDHRHFITYCDV